MKPGTYVDVWVPAYGERVTAGVVKMGVELAHLILPDGTELKEVPFELLPSQYPPRADLRVGDIVTIPDAYPGDHEITALGDLIDLRHCDSGGHRMVVAGTHMLVRQRSDVADLYTDFRLPAPKPARMESLFT